MEVGEIRSKIKEIIRNVTNISVDEIDDEASLRRDLEIDSLSLMEIGVDVDYEFELRLPEETLQEIDSVDDAVALVRRHSGAE